MSNVRDGEPTMYWKKDLFLDWSDFRGIPDTANPEFSASSRVGFQCRYSFEPIVARSRTKLKINSIEIRATFRPMLSWVRTESIDSIGSPMLLRHEQGHFDLAEEFARKINPSIANEFQDTILSIKKGTTENYMSQIEHRIATGSLRKLNIEQKRYDNETRRGLITEKQREYNQRFESLRR